MLRIAARIIRYLIKESSIIIISIRYIRINGIELNMISIIFCLCL